ncbi:uncharacterized protein C9orf50 homolog [Psammomys obesus]|uniref:uncharacterized protein C9orf50 homolog n=1 Tax=Psammomys obesus TaxID=48139 RepID=UPI00245364F6|nr:uncharacterized protein C9orf50 homolog [Psammomys obesus]
MYRRQSPAWIPGYEPPRCPQAATFRRYSVPVLLPWLPTPEVRGARGAAGSDWQDRKPQRLSSVSLGTPSELLLPPLRQTSGARGAKAGRTRQPAAWDDPDTLSGLLGDLLPSNFRNFLHRLHTKSGELNARTPSVPQYPRGTLNPCQSFQCPSCSVLPDLRDRSLYWNGSFRQTPTLGSLRGETRRASRPSGEGSRPHRRYCPFRVRFADETLQDTALRYWERNRAVRQSPFPREQEPLPAVSVSERVLGNVGRWLDGLPTALHPRAQDTVAGSSWNYHQASPQESRFYFSENDTRSSRLPYFSRVTTPRPRRNLQTFLNTPNTVEQESSLPSLVLQSILKQGHPKGYQLLLPSTHRWQAQR